MEEPTKQTKQTDATDATPESANLAAENAHLRAELRTAAARTVLAGSLAAAGARTPNLLLGAATDAMQFADDGSLANADVVLAGLRTRFPEQFRVARTPSIDGGAGRGTPEPLTREALAKMKPAEIAKLDWAVVREVLSGK